MSPLLCHFSHLEPMGSAGTDVHDVTEPVRKALAESGVRDGLVTAHAPGSTAAVTTIEHEPGAVQDLKDCLERLAPAQARYAHDAAWGDGNGYSHLRAALLGPSLSVPVQGGGLALGVWQQIVVLDPDNRPRRRKVVVQVLGS